MDQPAATRKVVVANPSGFHARAALKVLHLVREFAAQVEIVLDRRRASAADMLQMLALGAGQGQELILEATGPQAEEVLDALQSLFAAKFHEEDDGTQNHP